MFPGLKAGPIVSVLYFLSYVDSENNTYYPKNTSNPTTTIYAGKIWWHASKMPLQARKGFDVNGCIDPNGLRYPGVHRPKRPVGAL